MIWHILVLRTYSLENLPFGILFSYWYYDKIFLQTMWNTSTSGFGIEKKLRIYIKTKTSDSNINIYRTKRWRKFTLFSDLNKITLFTLHYCCEVGRNKIVSTFFSLSVASCKVEWFLSVEQGWGRRSQSFSFLRR